MKFALVVPTLNEAGNIQALLDRAVRALQQAPVPWEIVVVDDMSADGTAEVVRQYQLSEPRVRLVIRNGQRGLAGAISYGWLQSDAEILGVIDADLQHPPELLPDLVRAVLEGSDLAIASRYLRAHSMDNWNPLRRTISRLGILSAAQVQNKKINVRDPMSGFFVVRRNCISGIDFQPAGFKLLLEILARGRIDSVTEVPFSFESRQHGKSKANIMTAVHYLRLLFRLRYERKQQ